MALGGGYHGQTPSVAQASYTATTSTGGASGATATASASLNLSQSSSEEKAALTLEDSSRLEYTLAFIKPDAMHPSAMSEILNIIKRNRIEIVNKKKVWLSKEQAEQFYLEHRGTEWFERLTSFISRWGNTRLSIKKKSQYFTI